MRSTVSNYLHTTTLSQCLVQWTGGLGGQQDQGHGVVQYDQGEGYQRPIASKIVLNWK